MSLSNIEKASFSFQENGYNGIYPPFYSNTDFIWVKEIEKNWKIIEEEIKENLVLKTYNAPHVKGDAGWKGLQLINFGWKNHRNCSSFPNTMKLIEQIPNLTFAAFSILEPGASLQPHYGDSNTTIRGHLGIEIPASSPECALQVANEIRGWETGKVLLFSECYLHSAWNKSTKRRIIFCFDSMHPVYAKCKLWVCARVMAAQTLSFLNNVAGKFRWVISATHVPLYWSATIAWYLYLPIQKRISFLP